MKLKKLILVLVLFSVISSLFFVCSAQEEYLPIRVATTKAELFVSTTGDDNNPGTIDNPFKTIEGAQKAIRNLKSTTGLPKGGITVQIRGGDYYYLNSSVTFNEEDSGTKECPIIYKRYNDEKVSFNGGVHIDLSKATPVSDKKLLERFVNKDAIPNIRQINLKNQGYDLRPIAGTTYGNKDVNALALRNMSPLLIMDDEPLYLSRYPNKMTDGYHDYLKTGAVVTQGGGMESAVFKYQEDRPSKWDTNQDIWIYGWLQNEYTESQASVIVDAEEKTVTTTSFISTGGCKTDKRFYFENVFEELDTKNEYYYDYDKGILYFCIDSKNPPKDLELAYSDVPLMKFNHASYITISGIDIKNTNNDGIILIGGSDITIAYSEIKNIAGNGIGNYSEDEQIMWHYQPYTKDKPLACQRLYIVSNDIFNIGMSAVRDTSGNRYTLQSGELRIENNKIHNFSLLDRAYMQGISLNATVGARVAYNEIYDAPHFAISGTYAETLIEFNNIYDVQKDTGDASFIYAGGRIDMPGNVVRYNYLHDMPRHKSLSSAYWAYGIYIDNAHDGFEIYGNIIDGARYAIFINGGAHNTVANNVTINCDTSIYYSEFELQRAAGHKNATVDNFIWDIVKNEPLWLERYPSYKHTLSEDVDDRLPWGAVVKNNAIVGLGTLNAVKVNTPSSVKQCGIVENNVEFLRDPGFVNMNKSDYSLKEDAELYDRIPEFKPIPFSRMGRYGSYVVSNMKGKDILMVYSSRIFKDNILCTIEPNDIDIAPYIKDVEVYIPKEALKILSVESDSDMKIAEVAEKMGKNVTYDKRTGLIIFSDGVFPFNSESDSVLYDEIVRQLTIR